MKVKVTILFSTLFLFLMTNLTIAAPPGFFGGVNDDYEHEEVVFISGEPITFRGTITVDERERRGDLTVRYNFDLEPKNGDIDGSIRRRMSFEIEEEKRENRSQTITNTELDSFNERIQIEDDNYTLEDYQLSKSVITDNSPASDFYSGNFTGRKYYDVNNGDGRVVIDMSGGTVGYENFWGTTETMVIDHDIESEIDRETGDGSERVTWDGTVRTNVSDSATSLLEYDEKEPSYSTYRGGYMKVTEQEMVSQYSFNLPKFKESEDHGGLEVVNGTNNGTKQLIKDRNPQVNGLIVPKFRDIGGHWAEEDIKKLYSLDVFSNSNDFFTPNANMTRSKFLKGLMRASDIVPEEDEEDDNNNNFNVNNDLFGNNDEDENENEEQNDVPFVDVQSDDEIYPYVEKALSKEILKDSDLENDTFNAEDPITRAEAITYLIRSLDFEAKAPAPGFSLPFNDSHQIPDYAKDSIYVAADIGLVSVDDNVRPNEELTRAEASVLLVRFLEFLEKDLQRDYREEIVLFY
ncbi:S-layer homology domain-containing protein [Natranaerobius trueperi]|uniref:S-layer protein n=1 Tax=Natranaerobius trueperi TaxID=759412 RepID=A0A226C2P0_9FIRM|nr:S-layer homology domain-containing protein [Natranaerobius trueperi]OWZ84667.1 S-layer protein [Natranaerobius trueperi]